MVLGWTVQMVVVHSMGIPSRPVHQPVHQMVKGPRIGFWRHATFEQKGGAYGRPVSSTAHSREAATCLRTRHRGSATRWLCRVNRARRGFLARRGPALLFQMEEILPESSPGQR